MKFFLLFVFSFFSLFSQEYTAKNFDYLVGKCGFSDELLKNHFTLYQGYVKNTNYLNKEIFSLLSKEKSRTYEYGALKRRLGWEFDGMRLHELYFENLGGSGDETIAQSLLKSIEQQFGSFDKWKKDFMSTGMMRGIGWVILCRDNNNQKLFNVWINEHDLGHLAGCSLLLVMDVWEHAYMTQYGLDREKYINTFFSCIDWNVVENRAK